MHFQVTYLGMRPFSSTKYIYAQLHSSSSTNSFKCVLLHIVQPKMLQNNFDKTVAPRNKQPTFKPTTRTKTKGIKTALIKLEHRGVEVAFSGITPFVQMG